MQWNLKRLFVAVAALAVLWTSMTQAQEPETSQDYTQKLRWKNGDILPGKLLESTSGAIHWASPHFSDDLVLDIGVLDSIIFPEQSVPATEAFRVGTVSGDIWMADIIDSDEDTFLFSSKRHGLFRVNRAAIYTLERRVHPNLVFDGSQLTNWKLPKEDAKEPVLLFGGDARSDWYADRSGHPRTDKVKAKIFHALDWPQYFEIVRQVGASGVGLYRTEFLYMNRETPPEEEEHYETYLSVLGTMAGLPLTIRTMDLGADKQVDGGKQGGSVQANPALGLRAVRLCLKEPALFRPQLRAILRASAHGSIRLMIPMLSNMQETRQVLEMIDEIKAELNSQGVEFDTDIPVGAMIEVPAAAICADIFAGQLDFLSIGTNDLIQYTIAIDRVDDEVSYLYEPLHPAVLRLIRMTLDAGARADIPVAMCGEMAGDIKFTQLLLALGLREFSVHPAYLLEVKKNILESELERLTGVADAALKASTAADVEKLLEQL